MSASPEHGGKCRALRGDRGKCAYTGQNCCCVLLTRISIFAFLLQLAPSVNLTVDTFPDKRGRLTFCIFSFYVKSHLITFRNRNSPLPSFLSGEQNRNDNKRKNRLLERAKNPARDTHNAYTDIKIWILYSLAVCCPRLRGKCRALRGDRGECAYTGKHLIQFKHLSASTAFLRESFPCFLILLFWKPENMSLFPQSSFKNGLKGRKNEQDITNGNNLYKTLEIGGK